MSADRYERLIRAAFRLGFWVSAEGFNSECRVSTLAPSSLVGGSFAGGAPRDDISLWPADEPYGGSIKRLEDEAVQLLLDGRGLLMGPDKEEDSP